jgi:hypothetical protein
VQNIIELEGGKSALKLTTAAYCRPSGKNIHRFPGAKDSDEWGVMPDKGFDLRLPEYELAALMEDRRDRDVLQPHNAPPGKQEQAKAEPSKPEQPKPSEKPVETPKPASPQKADTPKPEPAKPAEAPKPDTAKPPAPKPAEKPADKPKPEGAKSEVTKPAEKPATIPASKTNGTPKHNGKDANSRKKPFVDRQLELAVKYLNTELARAK